MFSANSSGCELLAFILYLCSLKQLRMLLQLLILRCELLAFILYLCSLKQLTARFLDDEGSCELLSKTCIFAL